jgi:hypothetical protein
VTRTGGQKQTSREYLEPLTGKVRERSYATVDLESKAGDTQEPGFTRPFLCGLYDPQAKRESRRYQSFRNEPHLADVDWRERHLRPGGCIDKLMNACLSRRFSGYVFYAHNGGNFDWLHVLPWLAAHEDEFGFEIVPIQTTIQVVRVWRRGDPSPADEEASKRSKKKVDRWEFHDSMRLLSPGMSLAKACATFKVPGKVDHDLARHEDDPSWDEYQKGDCIALAEVMRRYYELVLRLGGSVGITAPSTAMQLFRRQFLGRGEVPERIPRHRHWDECREGEACLGCCHEWIRRGYYGGRTEAFEMRGTSVHYFDVNSSYVASMRENMPIGERVVEHGRIDWRRHSSQGGRYTGFAEVTVEIPESCPIPPLPHVDERTNKLIFPVGRFHGVWSLEELLLLSDPFVGGRIVHVGRVVWFRLLPCFREMVDVLWGYRNPQCPECRPALQAAGSKEACPHYDEGLSALAKLMGNSTYGKFAMKHERTTIVFARADHEDDVCDLCGEATLGTSLCRGCEGSAPAGTEEDCRVWYQKKHADAPYIIPHIASHITALSRVRLWRYMRAASTSLGPPRRASELAVGDVVFPEALGDRPCIVEEILRPRTGVVRLVVRYDDRGAPGQLDPVGDVVHGTVDVRAGAVLVGGGRVMYCDTDSVMCDAVLPTDTVLGAMKDEYPGESLDFECLQPKLYILKRRSVNDDLERRRELLTAALAGDDAYDASTLDRTTERHPMLRKAAPGFKALATKVTMKGFDPVLKTEETYRRLAAGETIDSVPDRKTGGTKPWERLEKVRTLARHEFRRGPAMRSVKKSMRSAYDKRIVRSDGVSTSPVALDEPVGGGLERSDEAAE